MTKLISALFDKKFSSILCLNGELPSRDFLISQGLPLIAADGAANCLEKKGLAPEIIIGDLDSVSEHLKQQYRTLHVPCQNSSDFQKTIAYLKKNKLLPSIIVGMSGGHLDHILNNINLFMETDSIFYAPPVVGFVLQQGSKYPLNLPLQSKISIFGMPRARVSSSGLQWELKNHLLNFPGPTSCFNRSIRSTIQIEVEEGVALIMIYGQENT